LDSKDAALRAATAVALGILGDQKAVKPLIKLLADRHAVIPGISLPKTLNSEKVVQSYLVFQEFRVLDRVCDAAKLALVNIGTPEALSAVNNNGPDLPG
jgi:HEAT repeat protein